MIRRYLVFMIIMITTAIGFGQTDILTVAEKSEYTSTSRYTDVMHFITKLTKQSPYIKIDTIAQSAEGYYVPMLVIANPMPDSPKDIGDRIVVYIQANIHAGEVEGKESTQMLARDLIKNPDSEILKNVVVLITPILNIDGNEKINTKNRTNQVGPINGVGVRYNGQNLDLNRDAMKLETPEIKGVVENILNVWDPSITVDCHTTNGSFHEEPITFTWMMNPNGDRNLINYMRDNMMPDVHRTLWDSYNVENIFYGEFIDRMDYSKGWSSYACEPRYLVNYIGIRNRLAILNENYVYADYKTRVLGCYSLLRTILEYASEHKSEIENILSEADMQTVRRGLSLSKLDSFAIEYEGKPTPELITIKAFETDTIPGVRGYWRYKSSDRKVTVTVPYIADFYATKNVKFPYAYAISVSDPEVISLLVSHGINISRLKENTKLMVEKFNIDELKGSQRLNQGHYTNSVKGKFIEEEKDFPKGTYIVQTNHKLGSLIASLLEPQSDDGLLKWNYFDRYLVPQWGSGYYPYPVYKVMDSANLELE
ncbi:MAG: M14 family metallopeptidase [Bacteroidetes bacterium]|nr:M14 family metallopeptidase [Bacteroidota bacterium]